MEKGADAMLPVSQVRSHRSHRRSCLARTGRKGHCQARVYSGGGGASDDGVRTVADGGGRGDRGGSAGGSREAGGEDSGGADGRGCIHEGEKGVDGAGKQ